MQAQSGTRQRQLFFLSLHLPLTFHTRSTFCAFLTAQTRDTCICRSSTNTTLKRLHLLERAFCQPTGSCLTPVPTYTTHYSAHNVLRRRWLRRQSRWRPRLLERVRAQQCWIRVLQQPRLHEPAIIVWVGRYPSHTAGQASVSWFIAAPSICAFLFSPCCMRRLSSKTALASLAVAGQAAGHDSLR